MAECGTPVSRNVKGIVTRIINNRAYGYINADQYSNVFFHRSQVESEQWDSLCLNTEVVFDVYQNDKGWKAFNVCVVNTYPDTPGRVKWYNANKGYGYITTFGDVIGDVKFNRCDIEPGIYLSSGDNVKFDLEKSSRFTRANHVRKPHDNYEEYGVVRAELQFDLLSLSPPGNTISLNQTAPPLQATASAISNINFPSSSHDPFKDIVGSVVFWNRRRNFGFLKCPQGKVFIHRNQLSNGYNFLDRGDVVTFDIESSSRGFKAVNVRFIPDDASQDLYLSDESEYGATAAYNPFEDFLAGYASSSSSEYNITTSNHLFLPLPDTPPRSGRRRNRRRSKGANEVESGFDSSRFVDDRIPQQLICPICLGVFNDPVSAPCEHAFCKGCIYRWLREDDLCPVDRQTLDEDDLKPLPLLLRGILGQLRIRCSHAGCESIVNLDDIKEHESKCEFKKIVSQSAASSGTKKLS